MGMTIAEKILAKKSGEARVAPGDLVTVEVDTVVMIDNSFTAGRWREILKLKDPDRLVVVFDHRVPASTQDSAEAHRTGRRFVEKFGIRRFHDVGYHQGISHQLVADHGYALPGSVLVCSDSHTCSAGVFNCIARGVGEPDVLYAAIKGETWFRVGETVRYELHGTLSPAVTAKDAFLQISGEHGDHATQNVEFGGPGIASLSIPARKTLTTMGAELSAEFATFEADDVMEEWLRARNPQPFECIRPDRDARYAAVRRIELSTLEPLVAFPDSVIRNSKPVAAAAGKGLRQPRGRGLIQTRPIGDRLTNKAAVGGEAQAKRDHVPATVTRKGAIAQPRAHTQERALRPSRTALYRLSIARIPRSQRSWPQTTLYSLTSALSSGSRMCLLATRGSGWRASSAVAIQPAGSGTIRNGAGAAGTGV